MRETSLLTILLYSIVFAVCFILYLPVFILTEILFAILKLIFQWLLMDDMIEVMADAQYSLWYYPAKLVQTTYHYYFDRKNV